jgi:hypothetical protein
MMMYHNMNTIDYISEELEKQRKKVKGNLKRYKRRFEAKKPLVYHRAPDLDRFYDYLKMENGIKERPDLRYPVNSV